MSQERIRTRHNAKEMKSKIELWKEEGELLGLAGSELIEYVERQKKEEIEREERQKKEEIEREERQKKEEIEREERQKKEEIEREEKQKKEEIERKERQKKEEIEREERQKREEIEREERQKEKEIEREDREKDREREERRLEKDREERQRDREHQLKLRELELAQRTQQSEATTTPSSSRTSQGSDARGRYKIKLPFFEDGEDLDAYFKQFERVMRAEECPATEWGNRFMSLLKGKARDAACLLDDAEASDYKRLKEELCNKFHLTADEYRKKLKEAKKKTNESAKEFFSRIKTYQKRWVELSKRPATFDGLQDLLLTTHFIEGLSNEEARFIRERQPANAEEALKEATTFESVRSIETSRVTFNMSDNRSAHRPRNDSPNRTSPTPFRRNELSPSSSKTSFRRNDGPSHAPSRSPSPSMRRLECYRCGGPHRRADCPQNAPFQQRHRSETAQAVHLSTIACAVQTEEQLIDRFGKTTVSYADYFPVGKYTQETTKVKSANNQKMENSKDSEDCLYLFSIKIGDDRENDSESERDANESNCKIREGEEHDSRSENDRDEELFLFNIKIGDDRENDSDSEIDANKGNCKTRESEQHDSRNENDRDDELFLFNIELGDDGENDNEREIGADKNNYRIMERGSVSDFQHNENSRYDIRNSESGLESGNQESKIECSKESERGKDEFQGGIKMGTDLKSDTGKESFNDPRKEDDGSGNDNDDMRRNRHDEKQIRIYHNGGEISDDQRRDVYNGESDYKDNNPGSQTDFFLSLQTSCDNSIFGKKTYYHQGTSDNEQRWGGDSRSNVFDSREGSDGWTRNMEVGWDKAEISAGDHINKHANDWRKELKGSHNTHDKKECDTDHTKQWNVRVDGNDTESYEDSEEAEIKDDKRMKFKNKDECGREYNFSDVQELDQSCKNRRKAGVGENEGRREHSSKNELRKVDDSLRQDLDTDTRSRADEEWWRDHNKDVQDRGGGTEYWRRGHDGGQEWQRKGNNEDYWEQNSNEEEKLKEGNENNHMRWEVKIKSKWKTENNDQGDERTNNKEGRINDEFKDNVGADYMSRSFATECSA